MFVRVLILETPLSSNMLELNLLQTTSHYQNKLFVNAIGSFTKALI